MKKLFIILLLPTFILGAFVISKVNADSRIDYDLTQGNGLSNTNYELNNYIEVADKVEEVYTITIPDNFEFIADDDELELYLDRDTLAIAVRVKSNGYVYSSYNISNKSLATINSLTKEAKSPIVSGVSLDLFIKDSPVTVSYTSEVNVVNTPQPAATSTITTTDKGFIANVDFNHPYIKIKFDLHVTIEDGSLVVNIPNDSIEEYNPDLWDNSQYSTYYLLRNITVFQYFGSTMAEDDGYVIIPDGSGALISLEEDPKAKTTLILDVYGDDPGYKSLSIRSRSYTLKDTKRLTLPIYGVVHNTGNTGFYTIIESGAPYAQYTFRSAGHVNAWYSSYFNFRYRQSYEQYQSRSNEDQYRISYQDTPNEYDATLRFVFVSGKDADYVGVAKDYKDYLIEQDTYPESNRKQYVDVPTKIDFIGAEITQGILSTTVQEVTTYNEMVEILKQLQNDGYSSLTTSLKTFTKSSMGYRFDIFRQLGGKNDFQEMLDYVNAEGIEFSYYLDYIRSNKDYSKSHAQTLSKREIYFIDFTWMYFGHLVNDTSKYLEYAQDDVESMNKYGIENVALASFDRALYTSWDNGVKYSTTNQQELLATLDYYAQNNINTALYQPDAYLFKYLSTYYNAPISSSDYAFVSASIPFVQLVLSGSVDMYSEHLNFASDEQFTLLRLIEFGVFPSYVLTGGSSYDLKQTNSSNIYISEYQILKNRMTSNKAFYTEGLSSTIQKEMIDHTFLEKGVILVEYDDGTQILLNYNKADVTVQSYNVPALGYVVIS